MRLTRHTDNALRCLTYLAVHTDRAVTSAEIARRMGMSEDHLAKVVGRLASLGYVDTQRGRSGGVRLARSAADIRIGDVVRETEDNLCLVECFDPETNQCPIAPACLLAGALDKALSAFLHVLDGLTLADLVREPKRLDKLMPA
ncbi:MAG: Rrf2 family transcriptional regulator [Gemmatimonadetes bacterium]|nr:Rrf2 family transcriptional regulator [Gemmatimonadota bacterium]MBI3566690.1 Rrf2 family transcriptional regulator [Gemmatimonadota bacterium]